MDYKKDLQKVFSNKDVLLEYRYQTAKSVFMYMSFFFFLNYFLLGARFLENIFSYTLNVSYIAFLFSLLYFIYFFVLFHFHLDSVKKIVLIGILIVLGGVFILPFLGLKYNF